MPDGSITQEPCLWELQPTRIEEIKNMPASEVRELTYTVIHVPPFSAEDRARESFAVLKKAGHYRPMPFDSKKQ